MAAKKNEKKKAAKPRKRTARRRRSKPTKYKSVAKHTGAGIVAYELLRADTGKDVFGHLKMAVDGTGQPRMTEVGIALKGIGENAKDNAVPIAGAILIPILVKRFLPGGMNPTVYKKGKKGWKLF